MNTSPAPSKADKVRAICSQIADTYRAKNADYGDSASATFRRYGPVSYLTRISDKISRAEALTLHGCSQQVKSESVRDTLLDLATYAIMFAIDISEDSPMEPVLHADRSGQVRLDDFPPYYDDNDG